MALETLKFIDMDVIRHTVNTETGELEVWNTKRYIEPITKASIVCNETLREYALSLGINSSKYLSINTQNIKQSRNHTKALLLVSKLKYLNIIFMSSKELDTILQTTKNNRNRVLRSLQQDGIIQHYSTKEAREKNTYKIVLHPFIAYSGFNHIAAVRHYVSINSLDSREAFKILTDIDYNNLTDEEYTDYEALEMANNYNSSLDFNTKLPRSTMLYKILQANDAIFSLWLNKEITTEELLQHT